MHPGCRVIATLCIYSKILQLDRECQVLFHPVLNSFLPQPVSLFWLYLFQIGAHYCYFLHPTGLEKEPLLAFLKLDIRNSLYWWVSLESENSYALAPENRSAGGGSNVWVLEDLFKLKIIIGCSGSSLQCMLFVAMQGLLLVVGHGLLLLLWNKVVLQGLSCPAACRILVPWLGMEPASRALEIGFLTTGLPGKSLESLCCSFTS